MIEFDGALALLADNVRPLGSEQVELAAAHGRVLAEDVHALVSSPRRAVSAMDGFALRDADARVGASLRVIGRSFAGHPLPPALSAGECVRIFTGAALPDGADRVIMQENCLADETMMTIVNAFGPGSHVRLAGSDFAEGDLVLKSGTLLDPRAIVALAGADRAVVQVAKRPRVVIIATGDELVMPGEAPRPDQIIASTGGKQVPWESTSLEGDLYFVAPPALAAAAGVPAGNRVSGGGSTPVAAAPGSTRSTARPSSTRRWRRCTATSTSPRARSCWRQRI